MNHFLEMVDDWELLKMDYQKVKGGNKETDYKTESWAPNLKQKWFAMVYDEW